jgi:hypothetical protein
MNMDPHPHPSRRTLVQQLIVAVVLANGCNVPDDEPHQDTDMHPGTGETGTTGGPSGPCEIIEQADVDIDLELQGGCYEVATLLSIEGSTLSMQPGVQITFAENSGLMIGQGGVLSVIGSADDPVVMEGESGVPGGWSGLRFLGSASSANRLEHVELAFAGAFGGAGGGAAVTLSSGSRLHVSASTIRDTAGFAITATDTSELTLETTTIEGNVRALSLDANTVDGVAADNAFEANDQNVAVVTGGRVGSDVTWQAIGIPLHPESHLRIEAVLTLQPGVTIAMAQQAQIDVLASGQLNAVGTQDTAVTFTAQQAEVGYWKGISVESKSSNNVFDHCIVEYGGGDQWTGAGDSAGMVYLKADSKLTVRNSTLRHSGHYALQAERTADLSGFEGNTIASNVRTLMVEPESGGSIAVDNVFEDNGEQKVRVVHGNNDRITTDQTWRALSVPWLVVDRFRVAAAWTIEAGTTMEFAQGRQVIIDHEGGSITAVGTADHPIVFTGVEPLAGYWQGIEVESLSAANQLEHAVVAYAGSDGWVGGTDREAAIYVDGGNGGGSLTLSDVVIRESAGNGILLLDDSTVTCNGVTFEAIAKELVAGMGASTGCI